MKQQVAAQIVARTDPTNPIRECLPIQLQQENDIRDNTSPPLPIKPIRRKPGMLNRFKESMIHEIMKDVPRNLEKITPIHTLPPWRTDARDTQYAKRLTINPAQRGLTKGEAADAHCTRLAQISQEEDHIVVYTDGSMKERE